MALKSQQTKFWSSRKSNCSTWLLGNVESGTRAQFACEHLIKDVDQKNQTAGLYNTSLRAMILVVG